MPSATVVVKSTGERVVRVVSGGGRPGPPGGPGPSAYDLAVTNGFDGTEAEWLNSLRNGPQGEPGTPGRSAYAIAVDAGYSGTVTDWLNSLRGEPGQDGQPGRSAYQLAVDNGYNGTVTAWLASLRGEPGQPGTNGTNGAPGTPGQPGASAYDLAVQQGFTGTLSQWLDSLVGPPGADGTGGGGTGGTGEQGPAGASAYDIAVTHGFSGTEAAWLLSLRGPAGEPGQDGTDGQNGAPGQNGQDGASAYQVAVANGYAGTQAAWLASLQGQDGAPGQPGADGLSVLATTGAPNNALGRDGEYAMDTAAGIIYGPKAAGAWPGGRSLVGPSGSGGSSIGPGFTVIPSVPRTSAWYIAPGQGTAATVTMGSGEFRTTPVYFKGSVTPASIGVNVSTAAASTALRLALYNADPDTAYPTTLVRDLGSVDVSTTGTKTVAPGGAIPAGAYCLVASINGAGSPALRCINGGGGIPLSAAPSSSSAAASWYVGAQTLGSNSWPTTHPATGGTTSAVRFDIAF